MILGRSRCQFTLEEKDSDWNTRPDARSGRTGCAAASGTVHQGLFHKFATTDFSRAKSESSKTKLAARERVRVHDPPRLGPHESMASEIQPETPGGVQSADRTYVDPSKIEANALRKGSNLLCHMLVRRFRKVFAQCPRTFRREVRHRPIGLRRAVRVGTTVRRHAALVFLSQRMSE